jgi:hypothetical protein
MNIKNLIVLQNKYLFNNNTYFAWFIKFELLFNVEAKGDPAVTSIWSLTIFYKNNNNNKRLLLCDKDLLTKSAKITFMVRWRRYNQSTRLKLRMNHCLKLFKMPTQKFFSFNSKSFIS